MPRLIVHCGTGKVLARNDAFEEVDQLSCPFAVCPVDNRSTDLFRFDQSSPRQDREMGTHCAGDGTGRLGYFPRCHPFRQAADERLKGFKPRWL